MQTEKKTDKQHINRQYKDSFFRYLFANEKNKKYTLELYNAINKTQYTDPSMIDIFLLGDALYITMRNDVSFLIGNEIHLYEHQSTYTPNMPLRHLFYVAGLYGRYITEKKYSLLSSRRIPLPSPSFIVFYNGMKDTDKEMILHLSDSYADNSHPDLDLKVEMTNINLHKNHEILTSCKPLYEYSWLVNEVRTQEELTGDLGKAVESAIMKMPGSFEIHDMIHNDRKEVEKMIFFDFNDEDEKRKYGESCREEGREEGKEEMKETLITNMRSQGYSEDAIKKLLNA